MSATAKASTISVACLIPVPIALTNFSTPNILTKCELYAHVQFVILAGLHQLNQHDFSLLVSDPVDLRG